MSGKLLGRFAVFPCDLFRVQAGRSVSLRDREKQTALGRFSYDLELHEGKVLPAVGGDFIGPNGMSMRPPTKYFFEIAAGFHGNPFIFKIPEGTSLPDTLTLLHEHTDHYSLQTAVPCSLSELNVRLSSFLKDHGEVLTIAQFAERFPYHKK